MRSYLLFIPMLLWMGSCGEKKPGPNQESKRAPSWSFKDLVDARDISPDSLDKIVAKTRKPVILYFSGYACINARKIEDEIMQYFQNNSLAPDQTIVQFMADDQGQLPKDEKYFALIGYDSILTYGRRAVEIQRMFGRSDQPCFLKIDNGYHVMDSLTYATRDHIKQFFGQ